MPYPKFDLKFSENTQTQKHYTERLQQDIAANDWPQTAKLLRKSGKITHEVTTLSAMWHHYRAIRTQLTCVGL